MVDLIIKQETGPSEKQELCKWEVSGRRVRLRVLGEVRHRVIQNTSMAVSAMATGKLLVTVRKCHLVE